MVKMFEENDKIEILPDKDHYRGKATVIKSFKTVTMVNHNGKEIWFENNRLTLDSSKQK